MSRSRSSDSDSYFPPAPAPHSSAHRDSTTSAAGNIGAMLSSPYSDDEGDSDYGDGETDEDLSHGPLTPSTRSPMARAAPLVRGYQDQEMEHKIKSVEGTVEDIHLDGRNGPIEGLRAIPKHHQGQYVAYPPPPDSPLKPRQSQESGLVRPATIVEFPEPSLQPSQGHGMGYPFPASRPPPVHRSNSGPAAPTIGTPTLGGEGPYPPRTPPRSNTLPLADHGYPPSPHHLSPRGPAPAPGRPHPKISTSPGVLSPPRSILLPPPASPISPMLMAPPQSHLSPLSPPLSPFATPSSTSHSRSSSTTSESIRGFDAMAEKKATFREGHEELMSPFSPGPRSQRARAGPGANNVKSGMDFWKRFSVSVRLDEVEKNEQVGGKSTWLNKANETRGRIAKLIWLVLILILLIVAGIVAVVILVKNNIL